MNDANGTERALTSALRALAHEDAGRAPADGVEMRLRAEVRTIGAARRARLRWRTVAAALVLAAVAIPAWRLASRTPPSPSLAAQPREEITTAFLPLVYSDVPVEGAQIVRLSVPRSALASFGLAPPESSSAQDAATGASSATVIADVLVGDDGLARAVRFVRAIEPTGPTGRMEQTR